MAREPGIPSPFDRGRLWPEGESGKRREPAPETEQPESAAGAPEPAESPAEPTPPATQPRQAGLRDPRKTRVIGAVEGFDEDAEPGEEDDADAGGELSDAVLPAVVGLVWGGAVGLWLRALDYMNRPLVPQISDAQGIYQSAGPIFIIASALIFVFLIYLGLARLIMLRRSWGLWALIVTGAAGFAVAYKLSPGFLPPLPG